MTAKVGIVMGSKSDWSTMIETTKILDELNIPYEKQVVSAHRTPDLLFEYAQNAKTRGIKIIIAGAGGSAHLPGMIASKTTLPVLGVPIQSKALDGMDSLLSIVQMPGEYLLALWQLVKQGLRMREYWQVQYWQILVQKLIKI